MKPFTKYYWLYVLLFTLTIYACNKQVDNEGETINVHVKKNELMASEIFSKVDLYNFKDISIGKITKLIEYENYFYILIATGKKRVLIFDKEKQRFIKSIAPVGKGPDEFSDAIDIFIFSGRLYFHDFLNNKLYDFSTEGNNGTVLELPDFADYVRFIDSTSIVLYKKMTYGSSNKEYKINIYKTSNKSFKLTNQYIPIQSVEEERDFTQLNALYENNDTIYLSEPFSTNIYSILSNRLLISKKIDFGNIKLPVEQYYDEKLSLSKFGNFCKNSNYIWNINSVLENSTYFFCTFFYKNDTYCCFHNKKSKKTFTFISFFDNLLTGINLPKINSNFQPIYMSEEAFYFLVEPWYLLNFYNNSAPIEFPTNNPPFSQLKSINKLDNPLIVKYYFN